MITFCISLASIPIQVEAIYPSTRLFCKDYLTDNAPLITITLSEEDINNEQERSIRQQYAEGITKPTYYSKDYLETLALFRKAVEALLPYQVILCHGSAVVKDHEAYLFTAPSGTGKSTHTALWLDHFGEDAFILNDDKPLISLSEHGATIYGTPWMGKHFRGQPGAYPLKAICQVNRSDRNRIEEVTVTNFYPVLLEQIQRPDHKIGMITLLGLLDLLSKHTRYYRLYCNISTEAVSVAHKAMAVPIKNNGEEYV